jgi:predicted dinucleotide-binding enzyme
MKIGVVGSGVVGQTLAAGFAGKGHDVRLGTRRPAQLADWSSDHPGIAIDSPAAVAQSAEIVVLAVKGTAAVDVVRALGASALDGKVVIDATNPAPTSIV